MLEAVELISNKETFSRFRGCFQWVQENLRNFLFLPGKLYQIQVNGQNEIAHDNDYQLCWICPGLHNSTSKTQRF